MTEYDAAEHGQRGVILRRDGLHSSHLIDWRRAQQAGLAGTGRVPARRSDRGVDRAGVLDRVRISG